MCEMHEKMSLMMLNIGRRRRGKRRKRRNRPATSAREFSPPKKGTRIDQPEFCIAPNVTYVQY